jgi:hypothetical protein
VETLARRKAVAGAFLTALLSLVEALASRPLRAFLDLDDRFLRPDNVRALVAAHADEWADLAPRAAGLEGDNDPAPRTACRSPAPPRTAPPGTAPRPWLSRAPRRALLDAAPESAGAARRASSSGTARGLRGGGAAPGSPAGELERELFPQGADASAAPGARAAAPLRRDVSV